MLGSLAASLSAFNTGCLVGLPSSLIAQLETETDPRLRVTFSKASWLATLYLVAALPACLVGGYLSARFGRRQVMMVAGVPLFFTWVMIALAPSIQVILAARFISALAIGSTHPSVGVFVSEISHPDWRGSLGVTPSIFLALGILKVYLLGFLFDWRTTCWICSAGSLLMIFSMWACRETPYWLVENMREEEARRSMRWYRGGQYDITGEIEEIITNKREKEVTDKTEGSVCSLFNTIASPTFLRPFSCAGILYILAQWTGVSTMVFFMTTFFQQSGSSLDPSLCPVIVAVIRLVTAALAFFVLRYANRRYLFVISSSIIFLSTSTIATFAYINHHHDLDSEMKETIGLVPLLAVICMFVGHALGVVPVCQLTAAEVFPTEIRTLGSGICVAVATVANAVNSKIYPVLFDWLGLHGTFWLYSGVGVVMTITGAIIIPDNRGISLVKIEDKMLRERKSSKA